MPAHPTNIARPFDQDDAEPNEWPPAEHEADNSTNELVEAASKHPLFDEAVAYSEDELGDMVADIAEKLDRWKCAIEIINGTAAGDRAAAEEFINTNEEWLVNAGLIEEWTWADADVEEAGNPEESADATSPETVDAEATEQATTIDETETDTAGGADAVESTPET